MQYWTWNLIFSNLNFGSLFYFIAVAPTQEDRVNEEDEQYAFSDNPGDIVDIKSKTGTKFTELLSEKAYGTFVEVSYNNEWHKAKENFNTSLNFNFLYGTDSFQSCSSFRSLKVAIYVKSINSLYLINSTSLLVR